MKVAAVGEAVARSWNESRGMLNISIVDCIVPTSRGISNPNSRADGSLGMEMSY